MKKIMAFIKNKKYLIIILLLSFLIVSFSFAYFVTQISPGQHLPINVITDIPEELIFHIDHDLTLNVNQFTLTENGKNIFDVTPGTASFKAGSKTGTTKNYTVYFNILENSYTYTTDTRKPEIILKVEGPNGEVKDIPDSSLNYNDTLGGFDVTMAQGLIKLADEEITNEVGTAPTIEEWTFTLTFINLDTIQVPNANKKFNAKIIMHEGEYEFQSLADYIIANASKEELIQHTGGVGANDGNYRYTGGGYKVTEKYAEQYKSVYDVIPVKLNDNTIHKNNYWWSTDRKFYLAYQEDQTSTSLKTLLTKALDDGYVEAKDINNYVCFGASEQICPKDNLYRIIGVYGEDDSRQVKLIKAGIANKNELGDKGSFGVDGSHEATYIGDSTYNSVRYYWDINGDSKQATWTNSTLNTVNLNTNFVQYLTNLEGGKWIEKIAYTDWQVGGMTPQNGFNSNAKTAYDYELGNSKNDVTENAKIGLMYVSDYYYAASKKYWTLTGYDGRYPDVTIETSIDYRGSIWDNWLWIGDSEWLITPEAENTSGMAFRVNHTGYVASPGVSNFAYAIRPCFYLNSNVEYVSGDGSIDNPYRIS